MSAEQSPKPEPTLTPEQWAKFRAIFGDLQPTLAVMEVKAEEAHALLAEVARRLREHRDNPNTDR